LALGYAVLAKEALNLNSTFRESIAISRYIEVHLFIHCIGCLVRRRQKMPLELSHVLFVDFSSHS